MIAVRLIKSDANRKTSETKEQVLFQDEPRPFIAVNHFELKCSFSTFKTKPGRRLFQRTIVARRDARALSCAQIAERDAWLC